jgi:flagellar basal-body rod protein FlgC
VSVSSEPSSIFALGQRAMSAQMVRMNAAASNLANAGTVASSEDAAYRPIRPVFRTELDRAGFATVRVELLMRTEAAPIRRHEPDHPLADENGHVWAAPIDESAEMIELTESARQYQNMVQALETAKQLMLETLRSS